MARLCSNRNIDRHHGRAPYGRHHDDLRRTLTLAAAKPSGTLAQIIF
jgi:hypothetical protein